MIINLEEIVLDIFICTIYKANGKLAQLNKCG